MECVSRRLLASTAGAGVAAVAFIAALNVDCCSKSFAFNLRAPHTAPHAPARTVSPQDEDTSCAGCLSPSSEPAVTKQLPWQPQREQQQRFHSSSSSRIDIYMWFVLPVAYLDFLLPAVNVILAACLLPAASWPCGSRPPRFCAIVLLLRQTQVFLHFLSFCALSA